MPPGRPRKYPLPVMEENMPTVETKEYSDGTTATGVAPLPDLSPAQQDAQQLTAQTNQPPDLIAGFLAALKQMSDDNRATTLAAIAELKKPSPEEQEKIDAERNQRLEQAMRRVEAAKQSEAEIAERQESCAHTMPNGQTNFRGQVNSNGWAHVFCSHCHKSYDFQATPVEATQSGLNVDKWGPNAHAIIRNRVAQSASLIPPPAPRIPAGATIIFG